MVSFIMLIKQNCKSFSAAIRKKPAYSQKCRSLPKIQATAQKIFLSSFPQLQEQLKISDSSFTMKLFDTTSRLAGKKVKVFQGEKSNLPNLQLD